MFSAESNNMQQKIFKQKSAFVFILLCSLQVESVVEKGYYWQLDTDHLDYLNTSLVIWNTTSPSIEPCLMNCAYGSSCKSVFYYPERRLCMASHSYKRGHPDGKKKGSGWMYYSVQYGCDNGYTHVGLSGLCLKLHTEVIDFHEAMKVCELEGAKLAVYSNDQEFGDLCSLAKNASKYLWIGITDLVKEGEWKFWNGKTPNTLHWPVWGANGGVRENCGMLSNYGAYCEDYPCAYKAKFVCQRFIP